MRERIALRVRRRHRSGPHRISGPRRPGNGDLRRRLGSAHSSREPLLSPRALLPKFDRPVDGASGAPACPQWRGSIERTMVVTWRSHRRRDHRHLAARLRAIDRDERRVRVRRRLARDSATSRAVGIPVFPGGADVSRILVVGTRIAVFEVDQMVIRGDRTHTSTPAPFHPAGGRIDRHHSNRGVFRALAPVELDSGVDVTPVTVEQRQGAVRFQVRVQPRASRTEVAGELGGALKIRLQAPPVDGAANEALVEFLADELGVSRKVVRIVSGSTSRTKTVEVDGIAPSAVDRLFTDR